MSFLHSFTQRLKNLPGWTTKRKIVVIESDDWGSIRMPSVEAYNVLKSKGANVERNRYCRYDSLESNDDLTGLYEVLSSIRDAQGRHPVFTAVNIVANPDFQKIRSSGYQSYFYEPFTETLKRYPQHDKVHALWKEGIEKRLFVPQFHGREHLNVSRWMRALQAGGKGELLAFDLGLTGLTPDIYAEVQGSYQAAFEIDRKEDIDYQKSVISEGVDLFEKLCGYRPELFVPTNGPLSTLLEPVLKEKGISYIQTARMIYKEPTIGGSQKIHFRYFGKTNALGQYYFLRNCVFEPSENRQFDWVGKCMKEIDGIFKSNKPAIITTHRVNYAGFLSTENRGQGLQRLKEFITAMVNKWPDIEFLTSTELGQLIRKKE